MHFQENTMYHLYNRGNNQERIFQEEQDYLEFLKYMHKFITPYTHILAWCLMPSHFHLLVYTTNESVKENKSGGLTLQFLAYGIKQLLSSYAKAYNKKTNRTGNLFQQKTKAKAIEEENYAITAFFYIHQNPWVAGMVEKLEDWPYSSYPDVIKKRNGTLINRDMIRSLVDINLAHFEEEVYQRVSKENEKAIL